MKPRVWFSLFLVQFLTYSSFAGTADKTLDIYWLDVEGGSATLIVTPENESVLIDTGYSGSRDAGRIYHVAAEVAGLKKIDRLVITHFHSDHVGGAADLAKLIPIGTVYDRGIPEHDPEGKPDDTAFIRLITPYREMKADQRLIIKPDDVIPLQQSSDDKIARVSLRCLAVKQEFTKQPAASSATNDPCAESKPKSPDTTENINSVVMLFSFGQFRMYLGGDLSWNLEAKLVCPVNLVGPVDVYQADHHGNDDASNPALIHALAPAVAVMSNGPRKGGGANILATLQSAPGFRALYQIHRDLQGTSRVNVPAEYTANPSETNDGNYIKLSAAPDGKSYTVTIPANGHHRTFQTSPKP